MGSPRPRRMQRFLAAVTTAVLLTVGFAAAPSHAQAEEQSAVPRIYVWWKDPAKNHNGGLAQTNGFHKNLVVEDFYPDGWGTRAQFQILTWHPDGYRYWKDWGGVCFDDTNTGNGPGGVTICERNPPAGSTMRIHIWASKSGTYKWHNYSEPITF
jgi:hypothetical protein